MGTSTARWSAGRDTRHRASGRGVWIPLSWPEPQCHKRNALDLLLSQKRTGSLSTVSEPPACAFYGPLCYLRNVLHWSHPSAKMSVSTRGPWLMEMAGEASFSIAESANACPHPSTKEHYQPNMNGVMEELCHPSLNFVSFFSCCCLY